ncbi:hypothetical protein QEU97_09140 [Trueperella pyogenes]|uniref:hypothetical protein n=1 Tax=Trueperella pyogenes TaxID=1661 RepID=UPI0031332B30
MSKKKNHKDLPKPLALIMTVAIIMVLPLPFAVYLGGIDWLTAGSQAGLKEFIVSYLLGLAILCIGLGIVIFKDRRNKTNHKQ